MHDLLENILNDIYTLDPSLREHDAEVRDMVSVFLAEKPEVKVDTNFAHKLRESLVASQNKPMNRIVSPLWMYLTPVAVAVLILMLVPTKPTPLAPIPTELPAPASENSLEIQSEPTAELYDAPSAKRSVETGNEDASMMMQMSADSLPMDSFGIGTQNPGRQFLVDFVSLTQPGFIVILSEEEVIGVSPLLYAGYSEQIIIPISFSTEPDQTYIGVLYYDDGDSLFDKDFDTIVLDSSGLLLQQLFSTTPILLE